MKIKTNHDWSSKQKFSHIFWVFYVQMEKDPDSNPDGLSQALSLLTSSVTLGKPLLWAFAFRHL